MEPFSLRSQIAIESAGEVVIVRFGERYLIEELTIHAVGDDLFHLATRYKGRQVILDLSAVESMSSTFLGKLLSFHRKLAEGGNKLTFCGVSETIGRLFKATKLDLCVTIAWPTKHADHLLPQFAGVDSDMEEDNGEIADSQGMPHPEDSPRLTGVLTREDIRQIERDDITLGDVIRAIEKSQG